MVFEGQSLAREYFRTAIQNPGGGISFAIEKGWLAGLAVEEMEGNIMLYLRASANLCNLSLLETVIGECRGVLPESKLHEAITAKDRIQELTANLNAAISQLDIQLLMEAIQQCESDGWPKASLRTALTAREQIEQLLAKIRSALGQADCHLLDSVIAECEKAGLPEGSLREAREKRQALASLQQALHAAMEAKDLDQLHEVIMESKACGMEQCKACRLAASDIS